MRIGDHVYVEKGGEIIPKIMGFDPENRGELEASIRYITHCPDCAAPLERIPGEAQHYCVNDTQCPPQLIGKIQHFVSRKAMDIDGIGGETISLLFQQGLIQNIADLYRLQKEQLLPLERMAEKSVDNLLAGVEASKQQPFAKVLFGLGIRHVGETVAKRLARHFGSMMALSQATHEELLVVEDIGEKIVESLQDYFAIPSHQKMIQDLTNFGLSMEAQVQEQASTKLAGKTIVVSGVFEKLSRNELKKTIEDNGGKVGSSISSKTTFVVAGASMGPAKKEKADRLNIPLISEDDFLEML